MRQIETAGISGQRSLKKGTGKKEFLDAESEGLEWAQGAGIRQGFVTRACAAGC